MSSADQNLQTPVLFPQMNGVKTPALIGVIGNDRPVFPFLGSYFVMASPLRSGATSPQGGFFFSDLVILFFWWQGVRFFWPGGGAGIQSADGQSDRRPPLIADWLGQPFLKVWLCMGL